MIRNCWNEPCPRALQRNLVLIEDGGTGIQKDFGDVDVSSFGRQMERNGVAGAIARRCYNLEIEFHQLLQHGHGSLFGCYMSARIPILFFFSLTTHF